MRGPASLAGRRLGNFLSFISIFDECRGASAGIISGPAGKIPMHRGAFALKALCLSVAAAIVSTAPSVAQTPRLFVNGSNSATASGVVAGAHGGYNWQNGPAVYGFEADFSAADLNSSMRDGLS